MERELISDPPPRATVVEIDALARQLADQLRAKFSEKLEAAVAPWGQQLLRRMETIEQQLADLQTGLVEHRRATEGRDR